MGEQETQGAALASAKSPEDRHRERDARGFERFLLFTDAVVAIAITLLILPVVERASEIDEPDATIASILRASEWQIFSFLLSFAVIAFMWLEHRKLFANVESADSALIWANLGWLVTIVFLAFTTALVPLSSDDIAAAPLYIANVALSSLMLTLCATILVRRPQLLYPDLSVSELGLRNWGLATGLLMLALVIVLVFPSVSYFALLLVMLQGPLRRWSRKRAEQR